MERLHVDIRLNTEASIEAIRPLDPYAVILATGGQPLIPDIEGKELPNVCHYKDVKMEEKYLMGIRLLCWAVVWFVIVRFVDLQKKGMM